MNDSGSAPDGQAPEEKLPRRDWLLLPLLSLFTIYLVLAGVTGIANRMFREPILAVDKCLVTSDKSTGIRAVPHTTCSEQFPEGGRVEYTFNGCGHRADVDCGPKTPGTFRIVGLGSSFSYGLHVQREQSFLPLLAETLSRQTGRQIEIYNESMFGQWPRSLTLHLDEVFAAKPDMILWTFTPSDVEFSSMVLWSEFDPVTLPEEVIKAGFFSRTWYRVKVSFANNSIKDATLYLWNYEIGVFKTSLRGLLLQHILYASQRRYVNSYLNGADADVGFLRAVPSGEWHSNLRAFDEDATKLEERARAEGVPLVAALLPNRAQAAMISMGVWPKGFDPYLIASEVRSIITRHGGTYVDILPYFRTISNPERNYFPVDGHPDARGHAMLSEALSKGLMTGNVPALSVPAK